MFVGLLHCASRSHSQSAILPTRLDSSDSTVSYPVQTYSACQQIPGFIAGPCYRSCIIGTNEPPRLRFLDFSKKTWYYIYGNPCRWIGLSAPKNGFDTSVSFIESLQIPVSRRKKACKMNRHGSRGIPAGIYAVLAERG